VSARHPAAPPDLRGYTYQQLLGSGGFADVFLYQQHMPRRQVAVKVLLADVVTESVREQFHAEANLMAQVSTHPAIVSIHHADIADDGRPYLVMEYCPRGNLSVRYRQERIGLAEALRIGVRLSGAVETAHRTGILHRAIKPANVLTTEYGGPALTDFGSSARSPRPSAAPSARRSGTRARRSWTSVATCSKRAATCSATSARAPRTCGRT
jgi:serine/threonine protein kinase